MAEGDDEHTPADLRDPIVGRVHQAEGHVVSFAWVSGRKSQGSLEALVMLVPVFAVSAALEWGGERAQDVLVVGPERRTEQPADVLGDDRPWAGLAYTAGKFGPEVALVVITLVHPSDAPRLARDATGHDVYSSVPAREVDVADIRLSEWPPVVDGIGIVGDKGAGSVGKKRQARPVVTLDRQHMMEASRAHCER
jgi:hypothetical protein